LSSDHPDEDFEIPQTVVDLVEPSGLPEVFVCRHPRRLEDDHQQLLAIFSTELRGLAIVRDIEASGLSQGLVDAGVRPGHVACEAPPIRLNAQVVEGDPEAVAQSVARRLVERSPYSPRPDWFVQAEDLLSGGRSDEDLLNEAVQLEDQLDHAQFNAELASEELVAALVKLTKAEQENRYLRRVLRELNEIVYDLPDEEPPATIGQAFERARDELDFIEFCAGCDKFEELDRHQKSEAWAIEIWRALLALDGFARGQLQENQSTSFERYLDDPPSDEWPIFDSGRVAMHESPSTMNDERCAAARVFRVPDTVDESGRISMVAHIKIANGKHFAPRIHFYDDTKGATKKVHVGHIGNHLPLPSYS